MKNKKKLYTKKEVHKLTKNIRSVSSVQQGAGTGGKSDEVPALRDCTFS